MKKIDGFDVDGYQRRLRLLREIISGENQLDFAKRLGVPFKRWSNYERGYPVPRETAFLLMKKFPGISVEWVWFGMEGNLSQFYVKKIREAQTHEKELADAQRAYDKAQKKLQDATAKRRKAIHPAPAQPRR